MKNIYLNANWHAMTAEEALRELGSSFRGLAEEEVAKRQNIYGLNQLEQLKPLNWIARVLRQFHNILIYVLLISGIIAIFLNYYVDASVIFGVVLLNALVGFVQEGKAERAIESIRELLAPNAEVVRGGARSIIAATSLVPGDIVLVKSGDKVPADLRMLEVKNLQVQEAILTGESNAVEKSVSVVPFDAQLADRASMAYSGTIVTYGRGIGLVVTTGTDTEIGKIGASLKKIQPLTTPILRQINAFGRWLTLAIIVLAAVTFFIGVWVWKDTGEQMFMAAIGVAVAAIPEGLPPMLTIILAIGVTRMAKRNAIIRQLPAVETMGEITVICTDKTGTLTKNEQSVRNILTSKNFYKIEEDQQTIQLSEHKDLQLSLKVALLCNDAEAKINEDQRWQTYGNPLDQALLILGLKFKMDLISLQKNYPRKDLIPYESAHKFMATLHHDHEGNCFIYVKGAAEYILSMCASQKINGEDLPIDRNYWLKNMDTLAKEGYRIVAIAYKPVAAGKNILLFDDVNRDLALVAVFGLIDAPRNEALQAVKESYSAGIKVKMITGDHATTAVTVASQVGIDTKKGFLTGSDIDAMDEDVLAKYVEDINVYARTSPQHKLRLVNALQENGELVAMTGDGVNDAPALRRADMGIAMGQKGVDIAKEAASMVLADDNFATIVHAIEEGRTIYDNLKKIILFILPTNVAEAFIIVVAISFGFVLPITPVQILWVNMITSVTLGLALGFEPAETDIMRRPPRSPHAPLLSLLLIWRVTFVTILLIACVLGLFIMNRFAEVDLITSRTIAVNMLVLGEAAYLVNCRKITSSSWNFKTIFGSKPVLIAIGAVIFFQFLFTHLPIMQHFFGVTSIAMHQWLHIVSLALFVFTVVEIEKLLLRKVKSNTGYMNNPLPEMR